jgi:hypothetical protein
MIPFSNLDLIAKHSTISSDFDGLLLFPKPLPVTLTGGTIYRPFSCGDVSELLAFLALNSAKLDKIRIRSVATAEPIEPSVLDKLVIGITPKTWLAILKTSSGQQDIWCRGLPADLVDQLRFIYNENLQLNDVALGPDDCWFIHARRTTTGESSGSHLLWSGSIAHQGDFSAAIKQAVTVNSVQFSATGGWLINFNESSWIWRGLPFRLAERLEQVLASADLEISSVTLGPFSDASWLLTASNLKTGEKQSWHGGLSKSFEADFAKVWNYQLFLGPGNSYYVRDESRTFASNFDSTLAELIKI